MEQKRKTGNRNKGGRPKKGAADKLKYRLTVKMATSDYYTLKGKARSAGVSAGEFLRGCMRNGQVKNGSHQSIRVTSASSAAWRTTSTSLRTRQTRQASPP